MNTIVVNEEDLDFRKYSGRGTPLIFEEFKLIVNTKCGSLKARLTQYNKTATLIKYCYDGINIEFIASGSGEFNEIGFDVIPRSKIKGYIPRCPYTVIANDADFDSNLYDTLEFELLDYISDYILSTMAIITLMGEERARKKVRKNNASPSETKSNSKGSSLKKKVYLLDDIVEYVSEQYIENHGHHTINCPCWEVRGHYRHYKSGKTIFIPSYKKGKEKDTAMPEPRQYYI